MNNFNDCLCPNILLNEDLAKVVTDGIRNANYISRNNALTFLHLAALSGCSDIVRILLKRGANINSKFVVPGLGAMPGNTLCAAASEGHLDVVKVLCSWAYQKKILLHKTLQALISACRNDHAEVAECLLSKIRIDINAVDQRYGSPLYAARYHLAVTEVLLKYGAEINVILSDGSTFLLNAIALTSSKRFKTIALLLQHGADVNLAHITTGETPLMVAALAGHSDLVNLLLDYGADVTQVNRAGQTVLDILDPMEDDKYKAIRARCKEYIETNLPTYKHILK